MADEPMERESTKHGPRADDRLATEASRRTDATALETAGVPDLPGEPAPPAPGARPSPPDDVTEGRMERALRAEIVRRVQDAPFPANRNDLLRHVGPDERGPVHTHLRALPPDIEFSGPQEVAAAFGGIRSQE